MQWYCKISINAGKSIRFEQMNQGRLRSRRSERKLVREVAVSTDVRRTKRVIGAALVSALAASVALTQAVPRHTEHLTT